MESAPSVLSSLAAEIGMLRATLPEDGAATELATEMLDRLFELGAPEDVIAILREGLTARQALVELGVNM